MTPHDTLLPALGDLPLGELFQLERGQLEDDLEVLQGQVDRPRSNIGSGPPGRAD